VKIQAGEDMPLKYGRMGGQNMFKQGQGVSRRGSAASNVQSVEATMRKRGNHETKRQRSCTGRYIPAFFLAILLSAFCCLPTVIRAEDTPFSLLKNTYMQVNTLDARFHQTIFISSLTVIRAEDTPFSLLKNTYMQVNTLEARFHQTIFISSLRREREFDGEFYYKRQKGFLWRYKTPKVKYFLYDGRFIWQGQEDKTFIIKDKVNKEKTSGTFLDLIEDIAKLDEIFVLKEHAKTGDFEILELLPKRDNTVKSARVWIDNQNLVRKIQLYEFTGNINTIEFSSIKLNRSVEDSRFIFKQETGKEIIER